MTSDNTDNTATRLAQVVGSCRRAASAAGHGIRASELEVLLLIAGGCDHITGLAEATGMGRAHCHRALLFLSGRSAFYDQAGGGKTERCSPFRLIEHRAHPHRRGYQWRLTTEGEALLSHGLQIPQLTEWTT